MSFQIRNPKSEIRNPKSPLSLDLALSGTLRPVISEDGQAVDFYAPSGNVSILHYAQLKVTDATGRQLPARFEGWSGSPFPNSEFRIPNSSGGIRIVADDAGATYPLTVDPLATTPAWTAEGNQASAFFGYSVATAGDVNGDGFSDVIVGAYQYNGRGRAFVFMGSDSGLSATAGWVVESDQAGAQYGISVGTAGDVNGDGYSDVIIGADSYDSGESDEGRAIVFLGSASGLGITPWTAESNQASASFGRCVGTAGDVNGDGYSDIIVGAPYYDSGESNEGRAFVWLGSDTGLGDYGTPLNADWTAESNQAGAEFGISVGTAGDVDGDGYSDVMVGAYWYDNGQTDEGAAFLYYGSTSGLNTTPLILEANQAGARYGCSVSTAGDVNGDGYSDVIVGAYFYDNGQPDEGAAFVYYGAALGLNTTPLQLESNQVSAWFGCSVSTAGDVNGDGYADVIVAASGYDNGQTDEGAAFLYYGSASGLNSTAPQMLESNQASAYFGVSVASAGDINGDGYSDVIVGAYQYDNGQNNEGASFVYLGSASGPAATAGWTAEGNQAGAYFASSVATAGDVNGDGYADVIVGTRSLNRVYVYFGSALGLGSTPWTAAIAQLNSDFGSCVGTAGDVNGDGYADIIVGAPGYDNGQTDEGRAYLYFGSASGLSSSPWTAESDQAGAGFGHSVGTAGDVNGDGYSDVIVGAFFYDNGQAEEGRAFVWLGSATGLGASGTPANADWSAESDQTNAQFGYSVATAGDVNGDGYADVIVGAHYYDDGETDEGAAFLCYGSASGLGSTPLRLEANQASAYFGRRVATAGDVNGDGYSDVIVGAPNYDNSEMNEGRAFVYLGSDSGLGSPAAWTAESDQVGAAFGESAGTAGDVNGDGYSDVIVGAHFYENGETLEGRAYVFFGSASGLGSTPWTAESNQTDAFFGHSVGTAGDVNGDGCSEVIVAAPFYSNGQTEEGAAFVYYGNGGPGLSLALQQRRFDDTAPISHLGRSDSVNAFEVVLAGRTPYGRGKFKLEWEAKALGTPFDGSGTGRTANWQDTGVTGLLRKEAVGGLTRETVYHWRARLLYNPVTTPFQQKSRWLTIPWSGPQEADLRTTGEADLGVTQTDSPDPLLLGGGNMTYVVTAANAGPDQAHVILTDTIPAGTAFVSATPSQGWCSQSSGVVDCRLGVIALGGSATVSVVVTPAASGSCTNHAAVSTPSIDGNPSNDACDETTTVNAPAVGSLVWGDTDGDGIQDGGESGLAGVIVQLYDSSYVWLAQRVTDPSGFYQFTGLTYGSSYFVKVIPPSPDYAFSQPDQGADDTLDSDVNTTTGQTPIFSLVDGRDPHRWDAGLVYGITCTPPDEACWIYSVTRTVPDNYPTLHFQDPNQPNQRTGWNIRRSSNPALPKDTWPIIGSNVTDMDLGTPNYQYTEITGGTGTWYYQVTAYNAYCPAEGPF